MVRMMLMMPTPGLLFGRCGGHSRLGGGGQLRSSRARIAFGLAVHLDDGVVGIDHHRAGDHGSQRGAFTQARQQAGRQDVELSNMTEGERPQKRAQEAAYGRANTVPIAPWRNRPISAMLSARATTQALTFAPA